MGQIKKGTGIAKAKPAPIILCNDSISQILSKVNHPDKQEVADAFCNLDERVVDAVCDFVADRYDRKSMMTLRALKMLIKRLRGISNVPAVQVAVVEKAVAAGWVSVFPLTETELKAINTERKTSYDIEKIKRKINNF